MWNNWAICFLIALLGGEVMLLLLYIEFLKVGALAFGGGYAAIPLIKHYIVDTRHWITMSEFTDLISISQMTPGPIAINSATFVGTKVAGLPGAIIATLGCVTPQLILMMTLGYFLFKSKKRFLFLDRFLMGVKPCIIGLILIAAISMFKSSIFPEGYSLGMINPVAGICFVIGLGLYYKKANLMKLMGLGAVLGIVLTMFLR